MRYRHQYGVFRGRVPVLPERRGDAVFDVPSIGYGEACSNAGSKRGRE